MKKKIWIWIICIAIIVISVFKIITGFILYPYLKPPTNWTVKYEYKQDISPDIEDKLLLWTKSLYDFYESERASSNRFDVEKTSSIISLSNNLLKDLEERKENREISFTENKLANEISDASWKIVEIVAYREINNKAKASILNGTQKHDIQKINSRKKQIVKNKLNFHKDVKHFLNYFE